VLYNTSGYVVLVTQGTGILLLLKVAAADRGIVATRLSTLGHKPVTCSSLFSNVIQTFGMCHYPIATLSRGYTVGLSYLYHQLGCINDGGLPPLIWVNCLVLPWMVLGR